jgi:integrase
VSEYVRRTTKGDYTFKGRRKVGGSERTKSFTDPSRKRAKALADEWETSTVEVEPRTTNGVTLAGYWSEIDPGRQWSTTVRRHRERDWSRWIEPFLGDELLTRIDRRAIAGWLAALKAHGRNDKENEAVLKMLSAVLNEAHKSELILAVPVTKGLIPPTVAEPGIALSNDQVAHLLNALPQKYGAVVAFTAITGLRAGEVFDLYPQDVKIVGNQTKVEVRHAIKGGAWSVSRLERGKPKFDSMRDVYGPPTLAVLIDDHLRRYGTASDGHIWTTLLGDRKWLTYPAFQQQFKVAVKKLVASIGFPPITFHDLRHTAISRWLADGVSPSVAQTLSGHKSLTTLLETYTHVIPGDESMRRSMAKISAELKLPEPPDAWQTFAEEFGKVRELPGIEVPRSKWETRKCEAGDLCVNGGTFAPTKGGQVFCPGGKCASRFHAKRQRDQRHAERGVRYCQDCGATIPFDADLRYLSCPGGCKPPTARLALMAGEA